MTNQTINKQFVDGWLRRYVEAWKSYDPQQIGALFAEDCIYRYTPFSDPLHGRTAIIASWLTNPDEQGTYDGQYETLMLDADRAIITGNSLYYHPGTKNLRAEFANIWVLRFNAQGECSEFLEWYMQRP